MKDWTFEPGRLRRLAVIFAGTFYVGLAVTLFFRPNYLRAGTSGHPELIDFSCFWAAGRAVVSGGGARVYDYRYFSIPEIELFGHQGFAGGGYPYVYPPQLLLYLAPLGLLPFLPAMALWLAATFLAAWAALRRIAPAGLLTLLAAVPQAVAWTIALGQTGLLATALIGFSLALIPEAPFAGGLVLGLLTYKPQFGLIFPVVLLAGGQWCALLGATASTAALAAATTLAFGPNIWVDFYASLRPHMGDFLPISELIPTSLQTVYGLLIWLGCSVTTAKIVHFAVVALMTIVICTLWRRPVPYALKAAALGLGALIATPYLLRYDLVILAVPAGFLLSDMRRSGYRGSECLALLAAWLLLFATGKPLGVLALLLTFAVIVRRAFRTAAKEAAAGACSRPAIS